MPPRIPPGYKPYPQKPTIYTGPDVPTAYNPNWQYFTNLTPAQIAAFQAFPEWGQKVIDYGVLLSSMQLTEKI